MHANLHQIAMGTLLLMLVTQNILLKIKIYMQSLNRRRKWADAADGVMKTKGKLNNPKTL